MTTTDHPAPLSVGQAIAAVMGQLPAIGKTESASGVPYKFRGIEAMTVALQPLMAGVGLVIVPVAREATISHSPGSKEAWQDVMIKFDWLIIGPDGSTITASTYGIGRDHTDKGANKAQTQAYKYLILHLFCVSDPKDDGDQHDYTNSYDDPAPAPAARRRPEVDATLAALAALSDADKDLVREWAVECGTALTAKQIAEDDDWRLIIDAKLERMRNGEPDPPLEVALEGLGEVVDVDSTEVDK